MPIILSILPDASEAYIREQVLRFARENGRPPERSVQTWLTHADRYYSDNGDQPLRIVFPEQQIRPWQYYSLQTDHSFHIFFLTLLIFIFSLALPSPSVLERTQSLAGGLNRLFWSDRILIFGYSLLEISFFNLGLICMGSTMKAAHWVLLSLYALLINAFASLIVRLPENARAAGSMVILIVSSYLGGCFFPTGSGPLGRVSSWMPQGWLLQQLNQFEWQTFWPVLLLICLAFLLAQRLFCRAQIKR